jgi:3-phosphoshikimate 1-carboxyvinyltransferase
MEPHSSQYTVTPAASPVRGHIRPPGSKSITNRALVCAALATGESTLTGALDSEDTRIMVDCLRKLGIEIESQDSGQTLVVRGCAGHIPAREADLFVGNSGTTIRFLTALCTLGRGTYRLDGIERMRERPIGDLVDALRELGAEIQYERRSGFPPLTVRAAGFCRGDLETQVRGDISSQYLSGLLMAIAQSAEHVSIHVVGELVSQPYVQMTLRIIEDFGGVIQNLGWKEFLSIYRGGYRGRTYSIEPDASAASYFWAAAAVTGGEVTIDGLGSNSLQGDVRIVECLEQMGCNVRYEAASVTVGGRAERGIDVNMNAISDTVQTLAAVALFAEGPTTIRGVAHIRHKETDRLGDLARELRKFGATVTETNDGLTIVPPEDIRQRRNIQIETYNDHRMAMSLALPGLVLPGISILNPACTAKTYPRYFQDLERLIANS